MARPSRPVLGIICCRRRVGVELAQAVMDRYAAAAMKYADCAALLIPSMPELMHAEEVASRLDGVLLTGSPSNVRPSRYGEAVDDPPGPLDDSRDETMLRMVEAMIEQKKPLFGVCRGFQEINVAFGGTLRRDVGAKDGLAHHAPEGTSFDGMFDYEHPVALTPGGVLARAYARDSLQVNSVHYQGADKLGGGLSVEARSGDGLIEAVSADVNGAPVLAVQWHPEWSPDLHPDSQVFFQLLGQAMRGRALAGLTSSGEKV